MADLELASRATMGHHQTDQVVVQRVVAYYCKSMPSQRHAYSNMVQSCPLNKVNKGQSRDMVSGSVFRGRGVAVRYAPCVGGLMIERRLTSPVGMLTPSRLSHYAVSTTRMS